MDHEVRIRRAHFKDEDDMAQKKPVAKVSARPDHDRGGVISASVSAPYNPVTRTRFTQLPSGSRHYDGETRTWWVSCDQWHKIPGILKDTYTIVPDDAAIAAMPFLGYYRSAVESEYHHTKRQIDEWLARPAPKILRPHLPPEIERLLAPLKPHQVDAAIHFGVRRHGILADEPGLGKTATAIVACEIAHDTCPVFPVLIIAPPSLLTNWQREIGMWSSNRTVAVARDGRSWDCLVRDFSSGTFLGLPQYVITGEDTMRTNKAKIRTIPWRGFVWDEAHRGKDRGSKRYQAAKEIISHAKEDGRPVIRFRLVMTGTPIMNRATDICAALGVAGDLGFFESAAKFERVFGRESDSKDLMPKLHQILESQGMKVRRKSGAGVGTQVGLERYVVLCDSTVKEAIQEYHDELARVREELRRENSNMISLGQHLEHLLMASALMKIPAVCAWAESRLDNESQVVIFYKHRVVGDEIERMLEPWGVVRLDGETKTTDRQRIVDAFQNGKAKVFLGQITASGVGLTLTAANQVCFAQFGWNSATMDQAEKRIHRIGQDTHCQSYWLVSSGTIEEHVVNLINTKRNLADAIVDGTETALEEPVQKSLLAIISNGD